MDRRFFSVFLLLFLAIIPLSAQEDEGDWFWNQPITRIEFEGLDKVKKSELVGITSTFINEPFTEDTYNELLDRLYAMDLFEDVEPYAKHDTKKGGNVLLVFKVTEHPVISKINYYGNQKIRNGELRDLIKSKASDIYVESKILLDERAIREHYIEKGYSDAKVSHKIVQGEEGITVNFFIDEGSTTVIREIHFSGNTIVSERVLKSKISLKEVGIFKDGAFQNTSLEMDKKTIVSYYKERGYVDATILDAKIENEMNTEKQRQELIITFYIQEGYQYTFSGLTITGNTVFSTEELAPLMKLRVGSIFNETKFEEGISAITGKYYENGYMSNEFYRIPDKDVERKEIAYTLNISENVRSHIENIIIKGNNKTKDYVIRREIPLESGDVFSRDKLISAVRNLYSLQFFSSVLPDVQMGSEQNLIDLIFNVEEQSTTSLNFGLTFSGVSNPNEIPISLYLKLENSNLFGEGKSISASTNISTTEQSVDLSYTQDWLWNIPVAFSESISYSHTKSYAKSNMFSPTMSLNQYNYYMGLEGNSASLGTAFSRRWFPDFAILTGAVGMNNSITNYKYDENIFTPVDLGISMFANRWGNTNSVFTSFSMDARDINYDPNKGWFASERLSWFGLIPKWEKEFFLKTDTKLEGYLTLCDLPVSENWNFKLVLAGYTGFTGMFPTPNSYVSDMNKLYIDGMINGRGWTDSYKDTGQALWSNKFELRFPVVPGILGLAVFYDAIVLKPTVSDFFNTMSMNDFNFSFGPGIRMLIPQLPLHLWFTWKYRIQDGRVVWGDDDGLNKFQFVLSFNFVNR